MSSFIDTSYWIALANLRDPYRAAALSWADKIAAQPVPLFTTEAVLWETLNALSSAPQRSRAVDLYRRVHDDPGITVIEFDSDLCNRAIQLYSERLDKSWSVVDCLSFVVMTDRAITDALTSDHHFEQAGFVALLRDDD